MGIAHKDSMQRRWHLIWGAARWGASGFAAQRCTFTLRQALYAHWQHACWRRSHTPGTLVSWCDCSAQSVRIAPFRPLAPPTSHHSLTGSPIIHSLHPCLQIAAHVSGHIKPAFPMSLLSPGVVSLANGLGSIVAPAATVLASHSAAGFASLSQGSSIAAAPKGTSPARNTLPRAGFASDVGACVCDGSAQLVAGRACALRADSPCRWTCTHCPKICRNPCPTCMPHLMQV